MATLKMVLQVQGRIMVKMPETLEEFFEAFPEIGKANAELVRFKINFAIK